MRVKCLLWGTKFQTWGHTPRSSLQRSQLGRWRLAPDADGLTPFALSAFRRIPVELGQREGAHLLADTAHVAGITRWGHHWHCRTHIQVQFNARQPGSNPDWARTKGRWLWGRSLCLNSVIPGQSISEQTSSRLKGKGPAARPRQCFIHRASCRTFPSQYFPDTWEWILTFFCYIKIHSPWGNEE